MTLTAVFLVGCGGPGRQAIEGTVTLDGQPLQEGYVRLQPQPGTSSPAAGAPIEDGVFSIASERGIFAGKFFVEITAMRPSGRMLTDPETGQPYQEKVQVLSERYNKATELTVEVVEGESNTFVFELDSK
ncbi:MAG: hypothetical protein JXM70_30590 [Pirellulales bacterium]|nr:hypothetical protein [Pirellulales bacterium]